MPDGRISRIRFEALAFLPWAFPAWRGLSAGSHSPRLPRFAHSLVPLPRRLTPALCLTAALLDGTAKCPESLCPMSVLPLTGKTCTPSPARTLLLGHRSCGLIRQSRLALLSFGLSLVQEVCAGCYQPLLPPGSSRRYLCESFLGCLVPCHGGPTECIYLFLPPCHRPSPREVWVGFPLLSANTTSRGGCFRGCRHFFMFRPPSLLVSQVVPTPAQSAAGQPRLLHPGRTCFVASARTGYASRPNTGN